MAAHTIVGFDMGIRNLAYCVVRHEGDVRTILAWDNVDLLEGGVSAQGSKQCCACTSPAIWMDPVGAKWCKGCATGAKRKSALAKKPSHPCVPCALTVKALRPLADLDKKAKKADLIAWATSRYLVPWKPAKAMDASLTTIRKAMDSWLTSVLPTFASASLIRLENQPVMKGPTMKSVQMILFTLLGHRLEREHGWSGSLEFVHAGTKSKGAPVVAPVAVPAQTTANAEGVAYRNRKKTAESDAVALLSSAPEWLRFFNGRSKKSDLADAFLMAHRARSTA
jgi:hypothetical protein